MSSRSHWRYPNLSLLAVGLLVAWLIVRYGDTGQLAAFIQELGYFGVFVAGAFFVSTFTAVPAAALLFELSRLFDPIMVAVIGGAGASMADYTAYRFVRDKLFSELGPILKLCTYAEKLTYFTRVILLG